MGEYLALEGGPSIVVNTAPCFEFSWEVAASENRSTTAAKGAAKIRPPEVRAALHHPFHQDSPAGQWLNRLPSDLVEAAVRDGLEYSVQFKDPFDGKGGFGASTAEFAGAWVFRKLLENPKDWTANGSVVMNLEGHRETVAPSWKSERFGSNRFRDILDDYRSTTSSGSGADLVSQVAGGISVWDARTDEMRRFSWPFQDLSFSLLMTGKKLATHQHLAGLPSLESSILDDMRFWVDEAVQSFAVEDADRLVASVRGFGKVLDETGRVADHTKLLLRDLADCSGIRAAKGCGAMGSDVLVVLHDRTAASHVAKFAESHQLEKAASDANIWKTGLYLRREQESFVETVS